MINVTDFKLANGQYDIQAAARRLRETGAARLYFPARPSFGYGIDAPLDLRGMGSVVVCGDGPASLLCLSKAGTIDCDGTIVSVENCRIYGDPAHPPEIGITFARAGSGSNRGHSVNGCSIWKTTINGSFQRAAVHVLCAELTDFRASGISNLIGHALVYDTNDNLGTGRFTSNSLFTNSGHRLDNVGLAVWNKTPNRRTYPLLIRGGTGFVIAESLWLTATGCDAFVAVEGYPASFSRGNTPGCIQIRSVMTESAAGATPKYSVLHTRTADHPAFPEIVGRDPGCYWPKEYPQAGWEVR